MSDMFEFGNINLDQRQQFWITENTFSKVNAHQVVNTKDGADRNSTVDVAATVQRVKDDNVLALVLALDDNRVLVLFRDHDRNLVRALQRVDENLVGEHIQFLLFLGVDIRRSGGRETGAGAREGRKQRVNGRREARQDSNQASSLAPCEPGILSKKLLGCSA